MKSHLSVPGPVVVKLSSDRAAALLVPAATHVMPLYVRLAEDLKRQILIGVFMVGQKLPSVRALSLTKHVSVNTVQEAYRMLEDEHWVTVKAQSGTYVARHLPELPPLPAIERNATRQITETGPASMLVYREDLLPLGAAVPHESLFPCRRLASGIANLLRATPSLIGSYNFSPGSIELRQQIARRVVEWDAQVDPRRVIITNGAVEAVQLCLRAVTKPGDTVVVESPAYYGFLQQLQELSLRALPIKSSQSNGPDLNMLEEVLAHQNIAAILLSTTVSNPSGHSMTADGKRRLVTLAQRYEVPIIEDATFADLHFQGACQAAQGFDRTGTVMLCASLTKTVAPGMRIGWVDGGRFSEQISYLKRITSVGQPKVFELALAQYLISGGMAKHLRHIRKSMQAKVTRMAENVTRIFPEGTSLQLPSGGFLLWVELPEEVDSIQLQLQAARVGISVAPGALFSPDGAYKNCIRLNCGIPDTERTYEGLLALSQLIRQNVPLEEIRPPTMF